MNSYLQGHKHAYLDTLILELIVHSAAVGKHFVSLMKQTHRLHHSTSSSLSLSNITLVFFEAHDKQGTSATTAN